MSDQKNQAHRDYLAIAVLLAFWWSLLPLPFTCVELLESRTLATRLK